MLATRHWDRLGNGGLTFTELGFGAAPLGNLFRAITDDEAHAVLEAAWAGGVRYFDTAPLYGLGLSETRLNRFLRGKPRDDYVLSTKIGRLLKAVPPDRRDGMGKWIDVPSRQEVYDYGYDGTMRSLEFSLERLGVERIDILYAHDLDIFNHGNPAALQARLDEFMAGGYRALVKLRDQGVIRAFGAGLNEWQPCQWLLERGDFDIFLLAGRYTLLEQEALESFLPLCQTRGVGVVIGGPYNSGILATGPRPGAHWNYAPAPDWVMTKAGRLQEVCAAHGVRLVDAAFRFPLLHPAVVSVIPGGQGLGEMASNLSAAGAKIPEVLWQDLRGQGLVRADG
ncbi:aldo/keto reductase [Tabrizicola sp.]|uniref:aldo/keto reductase n=1 Tax=Tabrizicola sp. TaxID=2005166 RepID=UPI0025FD8524|nr:aldo/keto reductase [Tabrizicola sp.]MBY0350900.1 aldo/keto reductase [Tabrizicola sp.]